MTHELKIIFTAYEKAVAKGLSAVLATVVALEGSSYRRPGVRMLLLSDGQRIGAVSGGCVEKEIQRQAAGVFRTNKPLMMTYDGRYRLGCEGILHILLEPMNPPKEVVALFWQAIESRQPFDIITCYSKDGSGTMGSYFSLEGKTTGLSAFSIDEARAGAILKQSMPPCNQLYILGAEHDSVALCRTASDLGWEVTVVCSPEEDKVPEDFPGALALLATVPDQLPIARMDAHTAVMVMSHNFARDVAYVIALQGITSPYIGILGPVARREQLITAVYERLPEFQEEFLSRLYGPAGIDIGAETAQEIAVAVMGEILAVFRKAAVLPLREKKGSIHSR